MFVFRCFFAVVATVYYVKMVCLFIVLKTYGMTGFDSFRLKIFYCETSLRLREFLNVNIQILTLNKYIKSNQNKFIIKPNALLVMRM